MTLLNPREAADRLGISEAALAQMRYMGTGPTYIQFGARKIMYREVYLEEWLESRTIKPNERRVS